MAKLVENISLFSCSVTDQLTNVLNRRAFDEQFDNHIQLMSRMGRAISLLMIDIDHFKQYNDRYGHPAVDEVLKAVASLLGQNARASDVVARYGGEEFVIILPNTTRVDALLMAERLRTAIHTYSWEQEKFTISSSNLAPA